MRVIGKSIGDNLYVHLDAWKLLHSDGHRMLISNGLAALPPGACARVNVAKVNLAQARVSFLEYANFCEDPFPVLKASWTSHGPFAFAFRSYENAANPPILHRKELLVAPDHPSRAEWEAMTKVAEELGLFEESKTIGFLLNWEQAVARRGYAFQDGAFQPLGNALARDEIGGFGDGTSPVQRHLTALSRTTISAPVQLLLRHGLLTEATPFFDYGCGRGGDVEALQTSGFTAAGWDPYYAPAIPIPEAAAVVNLGFVVNVIEDPAERVDAILKAFSVCKGVMSVGVMLHGAERGGKPFRDGVITSRGTFQRYFSQEEIKDFLEQVLHQEVFMVAPGIGLVFSDKNLEQRFIAGRYRSKSIGARLLLASSRSEPRPPSAPKAIREPRALKPLNNFRLPKVVVPRVPKSTALQNRLQAARPVLDVIWRTCIDLGRYPESDELPAPFGPSPELPSLKRAFRLIESSYDVALLHQAREARMDDLRLYFAMQHFSKRPRYRQLEPRLQRDIQTFFRDYATASSEGLALLRRAADPEALLVGARIAAEEGLGWLEGEHSLQVHVDLVDRLPVVLRAFVACGMVLAGGISHASLVKIHVTSAKLTLMEFDDFTGGPLPLMTRRIKVSLRTLDYDLFEYGREFPNPVLYRKSRFLHEDSPGYAEQLAFDEALEATGILGSTEFGPPADVLSMTLGSKRLEVKGMELVPSTGVPDLDAPCGARLTYRHFVECGETQERLGLANRPSRPESYNALHGLATLIIDPVIDYFGPIKLTYGFCSAELGRHIKSRVAPSLDQHAAEELKASGKPICERGGAACDFLVEDEDMQEVAQWVVDNLPFDRLYYYGPKRPLHVSWSPHGVSESYEMVPTKTGRLVPRPFSSRPKQGAEASPQNTPKA